MKNRNEGTTYYLKSLGDKDFKEGSCVIEHRVAITGNIGREDNRGARDKTLRKRL